MLDQLRVEDFLPLVGQSLEVEFAGHCARVEVTEASAISSPSIRATPAFHLILRAESSWRVSQGMFRLHHPTLGPISMFAVPIGPDSRGFCYEIVFN